ncbi:hypothetical protein Tco_1143215 [Tanacetum coccineum]
MVKICDGCQAIKRKETTIHITHFFDIMKQYKMKVNDIRAERIAKSANPLALLAAAQPYSDNYYQAPKPQRSNATSSSTRPSASTRHKGKEIAKPVTPQSESVSEEDNDPEHAQRDKDMQKNLALLTKIALSDMPCGMRSHMDTSNLAIRFAPNREETRTLANDELDQIE